MAKFISTRVVRTAFTLDALRRNVVADPNHVKVGLPYSEHADGITLSALGVIHE
jgi:hypothetical protein